MGNLSRIMRHVDGIYTERFNPRSSSICVKFFLGRCEL